MNLKIFIANHTYYYFLFTIYALVFWFYSRVIRDEKKIRENELFNFKVLKQNLQLQFQNEQLSKQKVEADYNYLRTQINPHFLYNTLGFFYSKMAPEQPATAEGILMLTNIMRYSLYQGDELGKVPLQMEIENLDNYIGLQKMRFGSSLKLVYIKDIEDNNKEKILPHLLITLVENAFKHGNNTKAAYPLKIEIKNRDQKLMVLVQNYYDKVISELNSTKTGLKNLENRLLLVYETKQQLFITKTDKLFKVVMQIDLKVVDDDAINSNLSNGQILKDGSVQSNSFNKAAVY